MPVRTDISEGGYNVIMWRGATCCGSEEVVVLGADSLIGFGKCAVEGVVVNVSPATSNCTTASTSTGFATGVSVQDEGEAAKLRPQDSCFREKREKREALQQHEEEEEESRERSGSLIAYSRDELRRGNMNPAGILTPPTLTLEAAAGAAGSVKSPESGRRRSVHFDACPPTTVVVSHQSSEEADDEDEPEEEQRPMTSRMTLPPSPIPAARLLAAPGSPPYPAALRRKSAPASAIRDSLKVAEQHRDDLSRTVKALDPELRRSFTKLRCTKLENPEGDLEVLKHKLVGRDELEIYRIKQMRRASKIAASIAHANALKGEIQEEDEDDEDEDEESKCGLSKEAAAVGK